jgi:hypothetical protein
MLKIRVSMPELQRRALLEVRKQPGCHDVREIAINRVAKHAENNWSLCVLAAGAADANTAARAAVHVQTILRQDYDLLQIDLRSMVGRRRSNGPPLHILDTHD